MTAQSPLTPDAQKKADSRRKRKALLAGGVVLGLGAAVTLAAWSDDVFANGIFNTGTFELEGNVTATGNVTNTTSDWKKYDGATNSDTDADLVFNKEISNKSTLSYGEPVFAPIALRLSGDTTVDATVRLASVSILAGGPSSPANTLDGKADYTVYSGIDAETCTAATPATDTSVWTQAATGTTPGGSTGVIPNATSSNAFTTPLVKATAAGNDQTVIPLCIKVTLNNNTEAAMGIGDTTVQWKFTATQTVS